MSTPNPIPAIAVLGSPEQVGAELVTLAAIKAAGSTPAKTLAAAEVALQVASVFTDAASGNVAAINAELSALVSKITDPGVRAVVTGLMSQAQPFIDAELAMIKGTPLLGIGLPAFLTDAAAGITLVANAYIAAGANA